MTLVSIDKAKLLTSLHSLRLTRRLSGVGKKISVADGQKHMSDEKLLYSLAK